MAGNKRNNFVKTSALFGWQRWRILIRTEKFWEDLNILNEKLLLFLDCANADQEKFGQVAGKWLYEYESLMKRTEEKWEIAPIPTWAVLWEGIPQSSKAVTNALIEKLEECYEYHDKEKPLASPAVRLLHYPISDFLDLRLDLAKPLNVLLAGVKAELKKFPRTATRKRADKLDDYLAVWDLRQGGLSADKIVQKLWPEEYLEKGGRDSHLGDKGPLIQRVYDYEKAAQKLIDNIRPY